MHHVLFNVLYDISKLLVIRDCRKPRFCAKRVEICEKSRKMGKLVYCKSFLFQRMCNNAVCTVPRLVSHLSR